ncbi:MAG: efflux RND transporter permease subunit [Alphaproteobacteria bacterium]|nr:efflux RND transporter permease subunit [Alphaproteobacteria bacterium]
MSLGISGHVTRAFIRSPLTPLLLIASLVVGAVALAVLPREEEPQISVPMVDVVVQANGFSAVDAVELVTKPLEDVLKGIDGVEHVYSQTLDDQVAATARFAVGTSEDAAILRVHEQIRANIRRLPVGIPEPLVVGRGINDVAILVLTLKPRPGLEARWDDNALWNIAEELKHELVKVEDVGLTYLVGGRQDQIRVLPDPRRLALYGVTLNQLVDKVEHANRSFMVGAVRQANVEYPVVGGQTLLGVPDIGQLLMTTRDGRPVYVKDVADVVVGGEPPNHRVWHLEPDDKGGLVRLPAVSLALGKREGANAVLVAEELLERLEMVRGRLVPADLDVAVTRNYGETALEKADELLFHLAIATVSIVALITLVLGWREGLVVMVVIPTTILLTLFASWLLGYTINRVSLFALIFSIGILVDDAIVVLENVYRHVEEGMKPVEAAIRGSREIAFAVVAMTITLAAVYVPIAFMTGRTGKLFTEFALTLASAVLVSGFVALTLSPMMCSRMLRHEPKPGWFYLAGERVLVAITEGYRRLLIGTLRVRWMVVVLAIGVAGAAWALGTGLKSELSPTEDRGVVVGIGIAPEGATVGYTDRYTRMIEGFLGQVPERDRYIVITGFPVVNQMISFMRLKDWSERDTKQQEVVAKLMPKMMSVPGMMAFAVNPPSLGQRPNSKPVTFVIRASSSYDELQFMIDAMMAEIAKNPGFVSVDTDLKLNKPQIRIEVDRDKVASVGTDVETVGRTLETMLGGRKVTRFKRDGEQYDVIVQVADIDRRNPDDIESIYVRGSGDRMIPLSNLIRADEEVAPRELNHFNQLRAAQITANLAPTYALGEAVRFLETTAARVLPPTASTDWDGISREYREASTSLAVTFVLALCFIYLVLAAQFESFRDPLVIMLTVPLAMAGALLALTLTGGTLNVYSQIGLVTLIGLITKHGILIVEFANQMRDRGFTMRDAVVEAAALRLRPIMMTTGAMVLGSVPLALATGAGAESRQQIGWVIVGGIALGTVLTLFVVPVAYTLLARRTREQVEHGAEVGEQGTV